MAASLPRRRSRFSVSECIFGWTAAFVQQGTHITARIQLNPDSDVSAVAPGGGQGAAGSAESKTSGATGSPAADDPDARPRARSPSRCSGRPIDPHLTVRVKKGGGRSNLGLWHTDDSGDVASHEFGHLLGHPDEYSEDDVCPNRNPEDTGTVMDDNTEVVARLCRPFCDRLSQDTTPA